MGELQKRIENLLEGTKGMGLSEVTRLEITCIHKTVMEIVEEMKKEFPKRCSAWTPRPELLQESQGCWNCIYDLDCPIPKFREKWLGER